MTHQYKKTKLAAAILAASVAAPASAVSWSAGDWEVSYSGFINSFANYANDGAVGGDDNFHLSEGLLPAFHTMKATSPATNGLTGTAQITFAPHTTTAKTSLQQDPNNQGGVLDVREVFFNVDGSFGTISVGRTLALFQRQSILNDMTLFGVGAFSTAEGGGTTLGRIGYGYVYGDFRNRFAWKSPDMNGFSIEVGMFDPNEIATPAANSTPETDTPQFQAELTYNTSFEGGSLNLWASGLHQEMTLDAGGDVTSQGLSAGGKVAAGGISVVATMYSGEAIGVFRTLQGPGQDDAFACAAASCTEAENDGYYIQGMYAFGPTSVGLSYGESTQDADSAGNPSTAHELMTIGVYHDVNSWLKVVGEYNAQNGHLKQDTVSLGGFIFW